MASRPSAARDVLLLSGLSFLAGLLTIPMGEAALILMPVFLEGIVAYLVWGSFLSLALTLPFRGLDPAWNGRFLVCAVILPLVDLSLVFWSGLGSADGGSLDGAVWCGVVGGVHAAGLGFLLFLVDAFPRFRAVAACAALGAFAGLMIGLLPLPDFGDGTLVGYLSVGGRIGLWHAAIAAPLGLHRARLRRERAATAGACHPPGSGSPPSPRHEGGPA